MSARWERIGSLVRRRRAENPGPMTLDGTNSYVLGVPGAGGVVVVDPGPLLDGHLQALAGAGAVELILITHHHGDHTDGSLALHQLTGAPVRAAQPRYCHAANPLYDGELIQAGGLTITVLATPGHTSDSLCFAVAARDETDAPAMVLTGDTILGQGSTVICYPDGRLGDYLDSLEKLRGWGLEHRTATQAVAALPGHGPVLADLAEAAGAYAQHRAERLAQVRAAVEHLAGKGAPTSTEAVTSIVYGDVPANLQGAAQLSVEAQLDYLRSAGSAGQ
ncbi:MBL fold metallo-hydrolase [Arthrobacter glacialis]|uniref:MBL fold metallo-hydrolase n=1 Tax=Arthrobacter glacialis TaxID=1664 RepID=A0A2S3ZZZ0_ARTGL|nr:MBL fold metallo-hydrolase [Arthrobacter glacialis]POH74845.1 MBL fold metallo-hydrolase [Arthrobacter glacialis]